MTGRYLTDLADVIRAAGCTVVEYSGWQYRARSSGGYSDGRPLCVMWHHTASQTDPANDAYYMCEVDEARPVANLLIARTGDVWVLAAGATNTNGSGDGRQFSTGWVDDDNMNACAIGMELANSGTGEIYPAAQIDAAFAASNACALAYRFDPGDVCTHYEWAPSRKIDPATADAVDGNWAPRPCTSSGTWELADLITECRRRATGGGESEDDMTDEDIDRIAARVWGFMIDTTTGDGTDDQEPARLLLDRTYNTVQRIEDKLS
jgi:hypothetical protein